MNLWTLCYFDPEFQKHGFIRFDEVRKYSDGLIDQYDVRSGQGSVTKVRSMSGGNQQKAIVAREFDRKHDLLIAVQPTRSLFIAILIAIAIYIMLNKTTFGYELKACGFNKNASKYAGMSEKRNIILSMAIAGALAAGGAALWCLNGNQDFKWEVYQSLPNDGFNGIPVALLANSNPIGVIFSSIFLRYINVGGSNLAAQTQFNEYVSQLIIAVIIYFAGFSKFIQDMLFVRKTRMKQEKDKNIAENANVNTADAEKPIEKSIKPEDKEAEK